MPLVAMGIGYDRPWRLNSWDRFAVPRPFSRARAVLSPQMFIPPDLDREGVEHYRLQVEQMLNRLTCEAQAWAEAGTPKIDEVPARRQPSRQHLKEHRPHAVPAPHAIEPAANYCDA